MKRAILMAIFLMTLIIIIIAANGCRIADTSSKATDNKKIQLSYINWVSAEMATRNKIDAIIDEFVKKNPNVSIENIPIPFDECPRQLVIMSESGSLPDIIQMTGYWTALLASQDTLIDLTGYAEEGNYILDSYSRSFVDAAKYNGKLYAIPAALTPSGFWYNKRLMEQAGIKNPPRTIDELNNQLEVIKEKFNGKVYGIGIDTTTIDYAFTENLPYFWAFGAKDLLEDPANPNFEQPAVLDALKWFGSVAENGYSPVDKETKMERELMANNKMVYKLDGTYFKGILQDINSSLSDENFDKIFGVTTMPTKDGVLQCTNAEIHSLGISETCQYKDIAWEFVKFMAASDYSVKSYIIPMGMLPPQRSSITSNYNKLSSVQFNTFLGEIAPYAKVMPFSPKLGVAGKEIINGLQQIFKDEKPEEVQTSVAEALKHIYNR